MLRLSLSASLLNAAAAAAFPKPPPAPCAFFRRTRDGSFRAVGLETHTRFSDFTPTPVAGLFPSRSGLYRIARALDEILIRIPLLRNLGNNFELTATRSQYSIPDRRRPRF